MDATYPHLTMSSLVCELLGLSPQDDKASTLNTNNERSSKCKFTPGDFAIDDYRPMKVVVIGAGLSGILAGIRFRQYVSNLTLTIYEKEERAGGTWWINRYPGVACDIPSHCYQYTFEKKSDWSAVYAPGAEIHENLENMIEKYKLGPHIRLRHKLVHALWDEEGGKWRLRVQRPSSPSASGSIAGEAVEGEQIEEIEDEADVLFMAIGTFSHWVWPDIEGLETFKGTLVHSANWNLGGETWEEDVKDWGDKSVAVIGVGSSALQIIPTLQPRVGRLVQYVRSRTWICPPFVQDKVAELLGRDMSSDENHIYTKEEIESLSDPARFMDFRRSLENELTASTPRTSRPSRSSAAPGSTCGANGRPHPQTYLGICTDGFPNCFFAYGPNSTVGVGVLTPILEAEVRYAVEAARKMQRERLRSMEVKREAVIDFDEVLEAYFPQNQTVYTEKVKTWYKAGKVEGRVVALWPGSTLHALRALQHPRWEDFNYELVDDAENRLYWLGNGMTSNEMDLPVSGDRAWFLGEGYVDVPAGMSSAYDVECMRVMPPQCRRNTSKSVLTWSLKLWRQTVE
ncbi:hypothetical protein NM688_g6982 [Phlebia brevispora]|uniref:Uncharacterized protein n=1 Tax=Phlebia brevispora TaxID=194682 RepID=A0ACC1SAL0_9APHY|nr:hypothetical protein NM688_g6982 [Phlebia brevispora]